MMRILDMCCGSRMCWFDRENPDVVFGDIRQLETSLCDGRSLEIKPDVLLDFRDLPFEDSTFSLVLFDPPHLKHAGLRSWLRAKYGVLDAVTWQSDLRKGFSEAFRVLKEDGILVFKWNENQIKSKEVLSLTPVKPLFGHQTTRGGTHWYCFMKERSNG